MRAEVVMLANSTRGLAQVGDAARRARRSNRAVTIGRVSPAVCAAAVLATLVLAAVAADVLAAQLFHATSTGQNLLAAYTPPALARPALWFGTDEFGRSAVVRVLYGARVSLGLAIGATLLNLMVGLPLGLAAGYRRGWLDAAVQSLIAVVHGVPSISVLLLLGAVLRPGPVQLLLAVGLLTWPNLALYVRGQTLALREHEFVTAARATGAPGSRIVLKHLLPNLVGLVITLAALDVGGIMLLESALSFLGLGIQPPTPSWGNLLTEASQNLTRAPWLVLPPGAAIFTTVLCLYLLGDGLRDALNPR